MKRRRRHTWGDDSLNAFSAIGEYCGALCLAVAFAAPHDSGRVTMCMNVLGARSDRLQPGGHVAFFCQKRCG
jgi:hypothetical protein